MPPNKAPDTFDADVGARYVVEVRYLVIGLKTVTPISVESQSPFAAVLIY